MYVCAKLIIYQRVQLKYEIIVQVFSCCRKANKKRVKQNQKHVEKGLHLNIYGGIHAVCKHIARHTHTINVMYTSSAPVS